MADDLPYRVAWSQKSMRALKEMGRQAQASGLGKELARIIREIDVRLRRDPITFGEVYRSRGAVEEHLAVREFIAIDYAVDRDQKFVLVRDCQALSGHW